MMHTVARGSGTSPYEGAEISIETDPEQLTYQARLAASVFDLVRHAEIVARLDSRSKKGHEFVFVVRAGRTRSGQEVALLHSSARRAAD